MAQSIVVEGVTKRFKLAKQKTIKKLVVNAVRGKPLADSFTALHDISFSMEQGDSMALMGLNGSGKSTLLKLISGVMAPDGGQVLTRGRIAGLIEVGAGLHPDLTGRENIFLNGAILGMSENEIKRKFDSIVEFSEVERFLDTEVRQYSSGMFMRLAFSTAVHTECDIFLIDEVLAVGDQPFRRKCLKRIEELRAEGRTTVYVSHNPKQVLKMCKRGIVLKDGEMLYEGDAMGAIEALGYRLDFDDDDDDSAE
jgi:ABC-2 type transport system ATP-binding protein